MLVSVLLPTILLFVLLMLFMRRMNKGGGMMGVGKSRAKAYVQKDTGITFKDVAGQDEAKESLQEVVDFLHNPGKYYHNWCETAERSLACRTSGNR